MYITSHEAIRRAYRHELTARIRGRLGHSQYPCVLAAAGWWSDVDPESLHVRPLALDIAWRRRNGLLK